MRQTRVLGKVCPSCGSPGEVVLETDERIIFECPSGHEYETKKSLERFGRLEDAVFSALVKKLSA